VIHIRTISGVFPCWAYCLSDDPLSVSSSGTRTSSSDAPAVLVILESEAEQAALIDAIVRIQQQARLEVLDRIAQAVSA